ncbi:unnamed protein product [Miscanthus lutarioriparius]|uniref:Epidermal patterning factor-like protein n=1 Tax=Miscanthus lutarioriparius TaxID=422564 RepID=A0A811RY36_9POAL|nr:unnamed protein product [Miscanthus lutarioriparius]
MPPPLLMVGRQPRWCRGKSGGSARTLGVAVVVVALVVSLCFIGSRLTGTTQLGGGAQLASDSGRTVAAAAGAHPGDQVVATDEMQEELVYIVGRRRLLSGGLGSHPPRCTTKCGSCNPCYPVHVSVPPGVLVTTEYYPEAWRCKCRDQLYMP